MTADTLPLVSIIIPAYNKADLTVRTVNSVLAQTYAPIEVIVVDDGSTDDTAARLAGFGDRIQYLHKSNGGACSARNAGTRLAQGEFWGFLDCDDIYFPEKVARSVDYLRRHPAAGLVHTAAQFIDREDKVVGTYDHPRSHYTGAVAERLIRGNFICNSTVIARRGCFMKVGLFDEEIFMPADWDMWLRIAEHYEVGYIPEPLSQYRVTDNYIYRRLHQALKEEERVLEKYLQRNPYTGELMRRGIFSTLHRRYACAFFLQEDMEGFRQEVAAALEENPANGKAWGLMLGSVLAPQLLRRQLSRRILRGGD